MTLKVQHQYKTKYVPKVGRALRENLSKPQKNKIIFLVYS